jgi:hypothetical protein
MERREFIAALGGAAAWPLAARAQQPERMKRIGVILLVSTGDPEFQRRLAVLRQALGELGWTERNSAFELRFAEGKLDRLPVLITELVQAKVDVIVTQGTDSAHAARKATSTIPIVMASIGDAVGTGIVSSLARPGGNVTGLTLFATEQSTKRPELIKEISPGLTAREKTLQFDEMVGILGTHEKMDVHPFAFDRSDTQAHFDVRKDQVAARKPAIAFCLNHALVGFGAVVIGNTDRSDTRHRGL